MDSTQYTLKEAKILEAVPTFPNDRNGLSKDVLLLAAYDFIDYFRKSVQAFEESRRDERYKPCMSQKLHADTIYKMIETRSSNPLYPDKNIVYQVYFIVGCLMGVPDHRRSWWEENFAIGIGDYLDKTYHFQGCKSLIQALIRDLLKLSQYEFDFDAVDQEASTATQTIQLRQQLQYQPIVAITPRPAKPENKTLKDMNQQNNNSTVYNGPVTINQGPVYQGCTFNTTNNTYGASSSSSATNKPECSEAPQSQPSSVSPEFSSGSSSSAPDVRTESPTSKKQGRRERPLFLNQSDAEQEKQRLLSFLLQHNLGSNDFDASEDNSCSQIAICFFRQWAKRQLLNPNVSGTALVRFLKYDCELSITVEEKTLGNVFSRMISGEQSYPNWFGDVSEFFQR